MSALKPLAFSEKLRTLQKQNVDREQQDENRRQEIISANVLTGKEFANACGHCTFPVEEFDTIDLNSDPQICEAIKNYRQEHRLLVERFWTNLSMTLSEDQLSRMFKSLDSIEKASIIEEARKTQK